jgi:hypothetical protein
MLHVITDLTDPLCRVILDDPVRPEIPMEFRVSDHSNIFVLLDESGNPMAAVCAVYKDSVPGSVVELSYPNMMTPHCAVFYTIWSYRAGAGRALIRSAVLWLRSNQPAVQQFVTLSPPTDMARIFHLRNGAQIYRQNEDTVNYIYSLETQ